MMSAAENGPNRKSPPPKRAPKRSRQSSQISEMRSIFSATPSPILSPEPWPVLWFCKSIGMWLRSGENPACISVLTTRAEARAAISSGHNPAAGNSSARYSMMASVSQIKSSPSSLLCLSTGTWPEGEWLRIWALVSGRLNQTLSSSNMAPVRFSANQPLRLHDDDDLLPMTSVKSAISLTPNPGRNRYRLNFDGDS